MSVFLMVQEGDTFQILAILGKPVTEPIPKIKLKHQNTQRKIDPILSSWGDTWC